MPTYGYRCDPNGHEFELVQGIREDSLTECIECGSPVHRIFYPVGIVFKGQGFYKTDSRSASSSTVPAASGDAKDSGGEAKTAATAKDSGGEAKTAGDSKPAAKAETKTAAPASKPDTAERK